MNTTAQVGGARGLAVLASVASSHAHGSHTLSAIVGGYHVEFQIGAVLVMAAIAVAFIILKDPVPSPDHEAVNDQRFLPAVAAED